MKRLAGIVVAGALAAVAGCGKKPEPAPPHTPTPPPPTIPPPKPTPTPVIPRKIIDIQQLFQGVTYTHKLLNPRSDKLASQERGDPMSYVAEVRVTMQRPRASHSREDFASNDESLVAVLDQLPGFWERVCVSAAFDRLYDNKAGWIRERLTRLDQLLSRHNYYDCETMLEFEAEGSGRKMLLLKGDMDVNVDGSDGDRNVEVDGSSRFFQPQTSYRWRKQTSRPNPFLAAAEQQLRELKDEYAIKGLSAERNAQLRAGIQETSRRIYDLKTWSFLISSTDPTIVVPGFMLRGGEGRRADLGIGDYAVVIYQGRGYPAIVGDAGPSFKFGEASLRLCREINPQSSARARPVSRLNVAYLVFPGSADEPGPPDLKLWNERCKALLQEVGLTNLPIHEWENIVPPWPAEPVIPPDAVPADSPHAETPEAPTGPQTSEVEAPADDSSPELSLEPQAPATPSPSP